MSQSDWGGDTPTTLQLEFLLLFTLETEDAGDGGSGALVPTTYVGNEEASGFLLGSGPVLNIVNICQVACRWSSSTL